jgi:hypothetical protein
VAVRIAFRLILLLGGLALATALIVGALSVLTSGAPAEATELGGNQVAAVERAIEAPADGEAAAEPTPTSAIGLVFAGIVLLAVLPPAHRVYVYHRSSYHRPDWY